MAKKYIVLLVIILIAATGGIFLFFRFGMNDSRSIADFSAAYQGYDRAVSAEASSVLANPAAASIQEQEAETALGDLKTKSTARISSLTKNDAEIMQLMAQIGDLSTKELDALNAYRQAAADQAGDMDAAASRFRDLSGQRQNAYARFRALSGQ